MMATAFARITILTSASHGDDDDNLALETTSLMRAQHPTRLHRPSPPVW